MNVYKVSGRLRGFRTLLSCDGPNSIFRQEDQIDVPFALELKRVILHNSIEEALVFFKKAMVRQFETTPPVGQDYKFLEIENCLSTLIDTTTPEVVGEY